MNLSNKQVIKISPDGTIFGLDVKPGKGIDLKTFNTANVVRVSSIDWNEKNHNEDVRGYIVNFLQGVRTKQIVSVAEYKKVKNIDTSLPDILNILADDNDYAKFQNYDDAVKLEIALVNGDILEIF